MLELGSGTGAVGLYAAALGASRVVLTDGGPPALLELLAANVDANRPLLPEAACLEVAQLQWGTDADRLPAGPFAWVCGSDTTYDEEVRGPQRTLYCTRQAVATRVSAVATCAQPMTVHASKP